MPLTPERRQKALAEGQSFDQFIDSVEVNREQLLQNYDSFQLSAAEYAFFGSLEEPIEVIALVHDWCGDVVANTPYFAKIERETGKLRLHLLVRDPDNRDIADQYPHHDGRNHIPTYIFYNSAGEELGVFIERPEEITTLLHGWVDSFFDQHPALEGRGKSIGELPQTTKDALLPYIKQRRSDVLGQEQAAIFEIIKSIVAQPALSRS